MQIENFLKAQRNCMFPDHDPIGNFLNDKTCNFLWSKPETFLTKFLGDFCDDLLFECKWSTFCVPTLIFSVVYFHFLRAPSIVKIYASPCFPNSGISDLTNISEHIEIFLWLLKIIVSRLNPFWALSNHSEQVSNVQKRTVADQKTVEKAEGGL